MKKLLLIGCIIVVLFLCIGLGVGVYMGYQKYIVPAQTLITVIQKFSELDYDVEEIEGEAKFEGTIEVFIDGESMGTDDMSDYGTNKFVIKVDDKEIDWGDSIGDWNRDNYIVETLKAITFNSNIIDIIKKLDIQKSDDSFTYTVTITKDGTKDAWNLLADSMVSDLVDSLNEDETDPAALISEDDITIKTNEDFLFELTINKNYHITKVVITPPKTFTLSFTYQESEVKFVYQNEVDTYTFEY